MELDRETQIQVMRLLRQKRNVDRFKARRRYESIAIDLGVSKPTLIASMRRERASGVLTPQEIDYAKRMRQEYKKHKEEFKEWSFEALERKVGCHRTTIYRYHRWMIQNGKYQTKEQDPEAVSRALPVWKENL